MTPEEERIAKRKAIQKANYEKNKEARKQKAKKQYEENKTEILDKKKKKAKAKKELKEEIVVDEEPVTSVNIDEKEFLEKQKKARENYYSSATVELPEVVDDEYTSIVQPPVEEKIAKSWFDFVHTKLEPAFADHRLLPLYDDSFRLKPVFDDSFKLEPAFQEVRWDPVKIEIPIPDQEDIEYLGKVGRRVRIDAGKLALIGVAVGNPVIAKGVGAVAVAGGVVELGAKYADYFF